ARAPSLEKPREKTVAAGRLEDLDPAAALESPLSEAISWRRSAVRGCAAELAHEHRGRVGHARHGDRDVIEENSGHGESILAKLAHAGKSREERNDAGKHGGALPDAAGDRKSRAPEPGAGPLGLPDRRRRDRDHAQAQSPGARLDRFPATRAQRR